MPKPSLTSHGGESDIVSVFQHRDLAGAVEGDVEFARQSCQRAVVKDVIMPFAGILARVEDFLRIDPGGRRSRDVANVVGAGTARAQAEILDTFDQGHSMLGRNFAHLQIRAGSDVAERPAQLLGKIGHPRELPVLHDAVRNPQTAHVGILRRCHVKQTVIAPAEIIGGARRRVVLRLLPQPRISIERMFVAFEFFLIGEFLAGRSNLVLRLEMRRIRSAWIGICLAGSAAAKAAPDPADLQAGGETFKVAFLLVGEVDGNGFDFHGARRSSCGHNRWHQRMG